MRKARQAAVGTVRAGPSGSWSRAPAHTVRRRRDLDAGASAAAVAARAPDDAVRLRRGHDGPLDPHTVRLPGRQSASSILPRPARSWPALPGSSRTLIPDLVAVIWGLLLEHGVQASGDCRTCTSVWPCPRATSRSLVVLDSSRSVTGCGMSSAPEDPAQNPNPRVAARHGPADDDRCPPDLG